MFYTSAYVGNRFTFLFSKFSVILLVLFRPMVVRWTLNIEYLFFRRKGPCHTVFCVLSGRWFRSVCHPFQSSPPALRLSRPRPSGIGDRRVDNGMVQSAGICLSPSPILGRFIRKARMELPRLFLILSRWPAQSWIPDLLQLTHVPPFPLVIDPRDLVQPRSIIPYGTPAMLHLHA